MKTAVCSIVIALIVLGCGQNPEKKAYDTIANPDGFPQLALHLIDSIESGQLNSYEAITSSFGELYSTQPNLLDNSQWEKVVSLLGVKFRIRGDSLAARGISNYQEAAQMYTLASFARPQDDRVSSRKLRFDLWTKAIHDSIVSKNYCTDPLKVSLNEQLNTLKFFMLGDSLQQEFGREYLLTQGLSIDSMEAALKSTSPHPLSSADRCFLSVIGFRRNSGNPRLVTFSEPQIDLIAAKITPQAGKWYAAELYFSSNETLKNDYLIALRVIQSDSSDATKVNYLTFDFRPQERTTGWKPKSLNFAYRRFACDGNPRDFEIGLYEKQADSAHFIPVHDSGKLLFSLPTTAITTR
jgi:hypothetical protein